MGNNQSSSNRPPNQSYAPPPPATTSSHSHHHRSSHHQAQQLLSPGQGQPQQTCTNTPTRREPRRRESVHALPWIKATAAPPSESLASATGESTTGQHRISQQQQPQHSQQLPSHQRSRTVNVDLTTTQLTAEAKMGNEESRMRVEENADQTWFTPSKPVPVPTTSGDETNKGEVGTPFEPAAPPRDLNRIPPSQINRPPRLPLPIGEEDYTPGSPIISPAEITAALNLDTLEAGLPRRSSILSSTTADDDETLDDPTGYGLDAGVNKAAVPTLVEWKQNGEKVYVTGTFAGWNKKFRLQKK